MNISEINKLLPILICPISLGNLEYDAQKKAFYSPNAKVYYPIKDGIPMLLKEAAFKEEFKKEEFKKEETTKSE